MSFFEKVKAKLNIKSKKQLVLYIVALASVIVAMTLGGITLAKYIANKNSDGLLTPEKFYFESNLLLKDGAEYDVGTNSIRFDLKSYDDNLRQSEVDISYSVSITCSDGGVEIPAGINTSGTLPAGKSRIGVEYNGLPLGKTYTVTARATSPYTKSISATFTLPDENNAVLINTYDDPNGYISYLELKTGNVAKSGIILWQDGYVPYPNALMSGAYGTSHNVILEPNSSYKLAFLKSKLDETYDSSEYNFCLETEFSDLQLVSNLNSPANTSITDTGKTYTLKNGGTLTDEYCASGYITIYNYVPGGNSHIQFKFRWTDQRYVLWDNNGNGKFGYGYIIRNKANGEGPGFHNSESGITQYDENGVGTKIADAPYPDMVDVTEGPVTLRWHVVLHNGLAYWYLNGNLIYAESVIPNSGNSVFNIGALKTDISVYGVEIVAKSEDEAAFNAVLRSLGIE